MAHPNEEIAREYLRAFNEGNLERVGELLSDDVVIHFPGRNPVSGDKRGKEEVMGFFRVMAQTRWGRQHSARCARRLGE